jgi:hypothetical protein
MRRVLYVRDDEGDLSDEVIEAREQYRTRMREEITTAALIRRVVRAGLRNPQIREEVGLPPLVVSR